MSKRHVIKVVLAIAISGVIAWIVVNSGSDWNDSGTKRGKADGRGTIEHPTNEGPVSLEEWKQFVGTLDDRISPDLSARIQRGLAANPEPSLHNLSQVLGDSLESLPVYSALVKRRLITPAVLLSHIRTLNDGKLVTALATLLITQGTQDDVASAVGALDSMAGFVEKGQADANSYRAAAQSLAAQLSKQSTPAFLLALMEASQLTRSQMGSPVRAHLKKLGPEAVFEAIKVCQKNESMSSFLGDVLGESLGAQASVTPAQLGALGRLNPESAATASRSFFSAVIKQDPRLAAKYFTESGIATSNADGMHYSITSALAAVDADAAAQWIAGLPSVSQPNAYRIAMKEWVHQDIRMASEFLNGMAPGPSKDGAIDVLVKALVESDIQSALAWAAKIADHQLRKDVIARLQARQK